MQCSFFPQSSLFINILPAKYISLLSCTGLILLPAILIHAPEISSALTEHNSFEVLSTEMLCYILAEKLPHCFPAQLLEDCMFPYSWMFIRSLFKIHVEVQLVSCTE